MEPKPQSSLTSTWKEQIRQVAARNPRLAQQLWQNRQLYFDRFAHFYRQLANLPRKFRRKFLRRLATTLAGAALLLALGQALPAYAAVINVDGVTCTLAEAIDSANNDDAAGNGCVDGSGADTIDLQTDVILSAPLPPITSEITLEGNGYAINGDSNFRVLEVEASGDLTLNNTSILNGGNDFYAGLVNDGGNLEVNDSLISGILGGYGGGIVNYPEGVLVVNNTQIKDNIVFQGYGGGILNHAGGTMTVNNSTISGNQVYYSGGGIENRGTGTINNVTISDNGASYFGGGIYNTGTLNINNASILENYTIIGAGGGIDNRGVMTISNCLLNGNTAPVGGGVLNTSGGDLVVNNCTISGNISDSFGGGGIFNTSGSTVTINNSTLTGNIANNNDSGGGIYNISNSILNLNHTLISGNSATGPGDEIYNLATVNANNYNVIGYGGDPRSAGFSPGVNDIVPVGPLSSILDPTLANNGGPTFTHALVLGSEAIDVAPNAPCLEPPINGYDQRGFPRNMDGDLNPSLNECDAGAYEFQPVEWKAYLPLITRQDPDTISSLANDGAGMVKNVFLLSLLAMGRLVFNRNVRE